MTLTHKERGDITALLEAAENETALEARIRQITAEILNDLQKQVEAAKAEGAAAKM
jgi:hypothetical protein